MRRRRLRQLGITAAILFLCLVAYNLAVPLGDPWGAVQAAAFRNGWKYNELETMEGSYSTNGLHWKAYGKFRVDRGSEQGVLVIRVVKQNPLTPWSLSEIRYEKSR